MSQNDCDALPFAKIFIHRPDNFFDQLNESCRFENICRGREACILVAEKDGSIPIVRTTTNYQHAAQPFSDIHDQIVRDVISTGQIKDNVFNNIMVERYTTQYKTMGEHSDHMLDLNDNSFIALYSCYSKKNPTALRTLVVKNKKTLKVDRITLEPGSVVLFSLQTNRNYLHKIILENAGDDEWIGLTMRNSKTFVNFKGNEAFIGEEKLEMATEDQIVEFRRMRAQENKTCDFNYPKINYTTSTSDLLHTRGFS